MVAEKGNERSCKALSALVRAMERKQQAAVLLFVPRVTEATVCVARPILACSARQERSLLVPAKLCNLYKKLHRLCPDMFYVHQEVLHFSSWKTC